MRNYSHVIVLLACIVPLVIFFWIYLGAHYPGGRILSAPERSYAESVFGDEIAYDRVRIHIDTFAYTLVSSMTFGNSVHFRTASSHTALDKDLTDSPSEKYMLMHELAHVYQYQHSGWNYFIKSMYAQGVALTTSGSRLGAYDWRARIKNGDLWETWNPEEQAEAISFFAQDIEYRRPTKARAGDSLSELGCAIPLFATNFCIKS